MFFRWQHFSEGVQKLTTVYWLFEEETVSPRLQQLSGFLPSSSNENDGHTGPTRKRNPKQIPTADSMHLDIADEAISIHQRPTREELFSGTETAHLIGGGLQEVLQRLTNTRFVIHDGNNCLAQDIYLRP